MAKAKKRISPLQVLRNTMETMDYKGRVQLFISWLSLEFEGCEDFIALILQKAVDDAVTRNIGNSAMRFIAAKALHIAETE